MFAGWILVPSKPAQIQLYTLCSQIYNFRESDRTLVFWTPEYFRPLVIHKDWIISTFLYFQETLEDLGLFSWDSICTENLLVQIAERCPRLKSAEFFAIGTQPQPDDLLDFFHASSHLQSIRLRLGPKPKSALITGDLLLHVSRMAKLKDLLIDNELSEPEFFWAIKKQNVNPFQNLKQISLRV